MKRFLIVILLVAGANLTFWLVFGEPVSSEPAEGVMEDALVIEKGKEPSPAQAVVEVDQKDLEQEESAPCQAAGTSSSEPDAGTQSQETGMVVFVCGAVNAEGVYRLPENARVYEAVEAAGGFRADADQDYVNQAQVLSDGACLRIPTQDEASEVEGNMTSPSWEGQRTGGSSRGMGLSDMHMGTGISTEDGSAGPAAPGAAGDRVDINHAGAEELEQIPGVGKTKAQAILDYRTEHGPFACPEDVMKVTGIKEGSYQKMKDYIRVS